MSRTHHSRSPTNDQKENFYKKVMEKLELPPVQGEFNNAARMLSLINIIKINDPSLYRDENFETEYEKLYNPKQYKHNNLLKKNREQRSKDLFDKYKNFEDKTEAYKRMEKMNTNNSVWKILTRRKGGKRNKSSKTRKNNILKRK